MMDNLTTHMPLVRSIAYSIKATLPATVQLDDLVSAGTIGLIDAVKKFNPAKQVCFSSYASFASVAKFWIRCA